jgi:hypothetical protein
MKKIILEEIEKFKLLTNYNNKMTLSENISLNEGPQEEIKIMTDALAQSTREMNGVFNAVSKDSEAIARLTSAGIKDSKGLLSAIKKGGSTAELLLADFLKGILKSTETTNEGLRTLASKSLANSEAFSKTYAKELSSGEAAFRKSLESKGYTKESIDALVRESKNSGKLLTKTSSRVSKTAANAEKTGQETVKTGGDMSQSVSQQLSIVFQDGKTLKVIDEDGKAVEQEVKDVAGNSKKLKVTDKPKLTAAEKRVIRDNIKKATQEANKIALMAKKSSSFWGIVKKAALIGIPMFAVWWFDFDIHALSRSSNGRATTRTNF